MEAVCLLPSYNRAERLKEFIQAYQETEATINVLILVDEKDSQLAQYEQIAYPETLKLVVTKSRKMGDKFREVWDRYVNMDAVMILNDDHRPKTKKWDQLTLAQVTGHNIIGTNDNFRAPQMLAGAITLSGPIIRALGWLFPPGLNHLYSDDVWQTLCASAGCGQVIMDVVVEHDHAFKHGKHDQTHKEVYAKEQWDQDLAAFQAWQSTTAQADIQKVKDLQPKTGFMIATPFHDSKCVVNYMKGMADVVNFFTQNNIYYELATVENSSLLSHARNSLADMFLKSKCQKLVFIDSDQGFDRNTLWLLMNSSRPVVAAITPHKRFPLNYNFQPLPEHEKYFKDQVNKSYEELCEYAKETATPHGEAQVLRVGTGIMMIDRAVLEQMAKVVPSYCPFDSKTTDIHSDLFPTGPIDGHYRGEDWQFCMKLKEMNYPVYINVRAVVPHTGIYNFSSPPAQWQIKQATA